jgi:isopenicillin-N N-acyltransferase-like protein
MARSKYARLLAAALLLLLFVTRALGADAPPFVEATREGGQLKYIRGVPVLFLRGDPEQMGRQQAALVMDVARPLADVPRQMARYIGVDDGWPALVGMCRLHQLKMLPRYQREFNTAITAAKFTEAERDALTVVNSIFEFYHVGGCSSLLVEPDRSATGEMIFGRNLDFPSFGHLDRLSLLTIYRPKDRYAFASVGFPVLGGVVTGINEKGLALAVHIVGRSKDNAPRVNLLGAPLFTTCRRMLEECSTIEEAEKLIAAARYVSPLLVVACDSRRAVVFEITTKQVVTREAEKHLLACTNHYRTDELRLPTYCRRFRRLEKYWDFRRPLTRNDVAGALRAVGVQRTLQTMIFEPGSLQAHLAIGPSPVLNKPLTTLDLAELFGHEVGDGP